MKKRLNFLIIFALIASTTLLSENYKVSNFTELNNSIKSSRPGDCIIMTNGIWKDVQIVFKATGTEKKHICLKAETPGNVFIEGVSNLSISGKYLDVYNLVFTKGNSPDRTVIDFKTSNTDYAYHCGIYSCVIDQFNQPIRETEDNWIAMWGKNNTVSNCYLGGKTNLGTTLIICPNDSNSIHNKHLISHNYFGPRPRLGSNGGESIRLGTSEVCTNSSESRVEYNYFEHCSGEVEIISNKSCDNTFSHNTFFECEGSLVLRHGNRAIVEGNWFIGNDKPFTGGIRIINEGHIITDNYFYKLRGDEFRSPLTIMNGIPNSPASGYAPVKNVLFANNTFYDCTLPWNFCVGVSERNRIVTPQNTRIINNLVYCPNEPELIRSYDKTDGITFGNNLMISKKGILNEKGDISGKIIKSVIAGIKIVYTEEKALNNLMDQSGLAGHKQSNTVVGAFKDDLVKTPTTMASAENSGPQWYKPTGITSKKTIEKGKTIHVEAGAGKLNEAVNKANAGDILVLGAGEYTLTKKITLTKSLTIKAASKQESKPVINMEAATGDDALFELTSDVTLRIKGVKIAGEGNSTYIKASKYAFVTGEHALNYSLFVDNCDISGFRTKGASIFNSLYCTFADSIVFSNSVLRNSYSGINLHKEKEDGKYNAETVILSNTVFATLSDYALDYYRGGYDESTVGGSLAINHCIFDSIGNGTNDAMLKLSRIMFVKINNSVFSNSTAKSTVVLWGLYNKITNCCIYNCAKPELTKDAKSKNLIFDNPAFDLKDYTLSEDSSLKGKATDGKSIGLKK